MSRSSIEWTEATWNPVAGCSIISPGCTNCYAMRMAARLERMGHKKYEDTTRLSGGRPKWSGRMVTDESALEIPKGWKIGRIVFVNSMSDIFHDDVPFSFLCKIFGVMRDTPRHTYQVLTKRAENLSRYASELPWPANVWVGVSVENSDYQWRIDHLRRIPAAVRFLSLEPLLGPLEHLDLTGIDWAIAGGESGPGARPMNPDWVRSIRDQCVDGGVGFHFKQWGGSNKKLAGRVLDGEVWNQWPTTRLGQTPRPGLLV